MCRMLAYQTREPQNTKLLLAVLKEFRTLADKGCVPAKEKPGSGHHDGWGVVLYKEGAPAFYYRSAKSARDDYEGHEMALSAVKKIDPQMLLIHLRKASSGNIG